MTSKNSSSASLLEQNVEIVGDISFNGNLYIQGRVNGNVVAPVESSATLYVQSGSEVIGELRVPTVIVAGKIAGDIFASRRISLKPGAEVVGNIHYAELQIDEGASVNGILTYLDGTPSS
jgi:cytoskeletal protein CcmA (bactofilin family)